MDLEQPFSVVNEGKAQQFECTKADALQLNKYWGVHDKK